MEAVNEPPDLGWHVIAGLDLLRLLHRVQAGEAADMVFAEMWANADHFDVDDEP